MFTLSIYASLLEKLQKLERFYLRHDVDLSLSAAAALAEWEEERGFSATYFLLVNGETYNLFSPSSRKDVERILKAGHKIGLHFDPVECVNLNEEISRHFHLLEEAIGVKASAFTLHRPAAYREVGIKAGEIVIPGRENWYSAPFFQEGAYLSDSNHTFRVGDPFQFVENFQGQSLQLLIHPEWWIEEGSPFEKVARIRMEESLRFDSALKATLSFYRTV